MAVALSPTTGWKPPDSVLLPEQTTLATKLPPVEPPPPEPTDYEKLRQEQLQQVETSYAASDLDAQWATVKAKYTSKPYVSSEEYYQYAALKQQYEQAKAGLATSKQATIDQVNKFYDTQKSLQEQAGTFAQQVADIVDANGAITDMKKLTGILPTAVQFQSTLQQMKDLINGQPAPTTDEEKASRQEGLDWITQQMGVITNLQDAEKKQEEWNKKGFFPKLFEGGKESFLNMFKGGWLNKVPLAFGPIGMTFTTAMGGLQAVAPNQMKWLQSNIDQPWVDLSVDVRDIIVAAHKANEPGGQWSDVPWSLLWTPEAKQHLTQTVPQWEEMLMSFTNPVYLAAFQVGGAVGGAALRAGVALPTMLRALPEAADALRAMQLAGESGLGAEIGLSEKATLANRASLWVKTMPQSTAIMRYIELGSKYPFIAERLPEIAEALRPITTVAAATMEPGALAAKVALWGGGVMEKAAGQYFKWSLKPLTWPLEKAAQYTATELPLNMQIAKMNRLLIPNGLRIVRETLPEIEAGTKSWANFIIKDAGGKRLAAARDLTEVMNWLEYKELKPATEQSLFQRVYIDELSAEVPGQPTTKGFGRVMPTAVFEQYVGKITETPSGTVYSLPPDQVGASASNLTVVTESQLRSGVRPASIPVDVWKRAIEAFRYNAKHDALAYLPGQTIESRLPPSSDDIIKQFHPPDDTGRRLAIKISKVPGGEMVINAINRSALGEDLATNGVLLRLQIISRGYSDVSAQLARIMQFGISEEGPFIGKRVPTADGRSSWVMQEEKGQLRMPWSSRSGLTIDRVKWERATEAERSMALNDIVEWIPGSDDCPFKFTDAQANYIKSIHQVIDDYHTLLSKEGIDVPKRPMAQGKHFVPRTIEVQVDDWSYGGLSEARTHETAAEGIVLGHSYGAPIRCVEDYGLAAWRKIATKRMADLIEPLGKTPTQIVQEQAPGLVERIDDLQHKRRMIGGGWMEYKAGGMKVRTETPGLRALVRDIAFRHKLPATQTMQAIMDAFPEIGAQLQQILEMPQVEVERALKAISDTTWRDVNRAAAEMVDATRQAVAQGKEAVARMAETAPVGYREVLEAIKDAQFERMFPGENRATVVPGQTLESAQVSARQNWFETAKPEVTLADLRAGIKKLNIDATAEQKIIADFYDRAGRWDIKYGQASQKMLKSVRNMAEADRKAVFASLKEAQRVKRGALKELMTVIDTERGKIDGQILEAQKQYDTVIETVRSQREVGFLKDPAFKGKLFETDVANTINSFYGSRGGVHKALHVVGEISSVMRTAQAALDVSGPFTYGLPLMAINPVAWARATIEHFWTLGVPEHHMKYLVDHQLQVNEFVSKYGGFIGGSEFYEGMGPLQKLAERQVGVIGKAISGPEAVRRSLYFHAERAFGAFGDVARLELWQALRPMAASEAELYQVAQMVNKMTGVQDTKAMGISEMQRTLESAVIFFAPRYRRAGIALMTDFFRGGISGTIARKALIQLTVGGLALYIGACAMLKQDPQLDPRASNFLTIRIGNRYYGIGSSIISNVKFIAALIDTAATKPSDLFSRSRRDNPFLNYMYKSSAPFTGTLVDLITNKNFLGQPLETPWDYATYLSTKITPMAFQDLLTSRSAAQSGSLLSTVMGIGASEWGMRTFEVPLWQQVKDMRNDLAPTAPGLSDVQKATMNRRPLTWDDLDVSQKAALEDTNPDLAKLTLEADVQSVKGGDALTKLYDEYQTEKKKIEDARTSDWNTAIAEYQFNMSLKAQMNSGAILTPDEQTKASNAGQIFRDKAKLAGQVYAARIESLKEQDRYQDVKKAIVQWSANKSADLTRPLLDQAISDYYTLMYGDTVDYQGRRLPTEDQYGNPIWDNIDTLKEEWTYHWGPELAAAATEQMKGERPAAIAELDKAKDAMKPYWDLSATLTASGRYPKDATEQSQWVIEAMQAMNPTAAVFYQQLVYLQQVNPRAYSRISSDVSVRILLAWANSLKLPTVNSLLSQERETYRRDNPKVEAYGEMFYDWQPLSTPTATPAATTGGTGWRY